MIRLPVSAMLMAFALLLAPTAGAQADWTEIELRDSRLQLTAGAATIESVSKRTGYMQDGRTYEELWRFAGGFLQYQKVEFQGGRFEKGGFTPFNTSRMANVFSGMWPVAGTGQTIAPEDVVTFGTFHFAYADVPGGRCVFFQEIFGDIGDAQFSGDELIIGVMCNNEANADNLPRRAEILLGALEKDGNPIVRFDELR